METLAQFKLCLICAVTVLVFSFTSCSNKSTYFLNDNELVLIGTWEEEYFDPRYGCYFFEFNIDRTGEIWLELDGKACQIMEMSYWSLVGNILDAVDANGGLWKFYIDVKGTKCDVTLWDKSQITLRLKH